MDRFEFEYNYFRLFNIVARLIGVLFFLVGSTMGIWMLATADWKGDVLVNLLAAVPLVVSILGFMITSAKPVYPQHIREWMRQRGIEEA